jgi:NAD(P)-dependent dehydrogenase (short-subunit alcohol dehydrogenase family)
VSEATGLLRPGLLDGISLLVAGAAPSDDSKPVADALAPAGSLARAVGEACTQLGARVHTCASDVADEAIVDQVVTAAVAEMGSLDMLVVDGAGLFAHGLANGGGAHVALRTCLDATWNVTRAVVNRAFLPADPGSPAGRIVYLAPSPAADRSEIGRHADAARASLENLGRTLSTEWARHGITLVTIAAGEATAAGEVAALTAYLASPAGAYFSGCLLDLSGP